MSNKKIYTREKPDEYGFYKQGPVWSFLQKYFKYLVLGALVYIPVFGFLDTLPLRIWDEARLANNAIEMLRNGNFLVTHFEGEPDMWSTKPPLMIWLQVICMKLIGVNEIAVRLPSAFAAFLTGLTMLVFSKKYLKDFWFGFIAVFVLITSNGYIDFHAARTGDYDTLLGFFTTAYCLFMFAYCEKQRNSFIYLFFISLTLAVLTKSVAGLLLLPAVGLYILIRKQVLGLLKNKHFYFGIGIFLLFVLGYYLLREHYNPGYIAAVQENELGGRYLKTIEGHQHGFWFYYDNFIKRQLPFWYLFIPCGVVIGLVSKNPRIRKLTQFSLLASLSYFLIISVSETKIIWYDVPLYPFICFFISNIIVWIFNYLKQLKWSKETLRYNALPFLFLFFVGISPYRAIIHKTYVPLEHPKEKEFYELTHYLQDATKGRHDVNGQFIAFEGYNGHNLFYVKILNQQGVNFGYKNWHKLEADDEVMFCQSWIKRYIDNHYKFKVLEAKPGFYIYKITGKKIDNDLWLKFIKLVNPFYDRVTVGRMDEVE